MEDHAVVPQHQAAHRKAAGRHRAVVPGRRALAPSQPLPRILGERTRAAILGAALLAGVSVAGMSAASAAPSHPGRAAHKQPAAPAASAPATENEAGTAAAHAAQSAAAASPPGSATVADADIDAAISAQIPPATLGAARIVKKVRPVPVALWVNPLPEGAVTSCFGMRWGHLHEGVDIATAEGTPIHAAGTGTVVAAGPAEGYGNAVLIDHGNGFLTHYGHMMAITVTVGQKVVAGQQIGNEGSTGHSTGPHLHFEVHQGFYKNAIEPTQWMHEHGVDIPGCVTFTDAEPAPTTAPKATAATAPAK
jgi:murein DD-endopeptidase MepM/ murein hydrolase activator NlpD